MSKSKKFVARQCSAPGCTRCGKVVGGLCGMHYQRMVAHGSVTSRRPSFEQRFWAKSDIRGADDCWPWVGARDRANYGNFFLWKDPDGKKSYAKAPRAAFYIAHGWWPEVARHSCDNPPCVNPRHILDGSQRDNIHDAMERGRLRHWNAGKTHCKSGHTFSGDNLQIRPDGARSCRACRRASTARYRARLHVTARHIEDRGALQWVERALGQGSSS